MARNESRLALLEKYHLRFYLIIISKVAFIKTATALLLVTSFEDAVFFYYTLRFCT